MGKDRLRSFVLGAGLERDKSATLWHACFPALRLILALRSHQRSPGLTAGFNRSGQPLQQRRFTSVGRRTSCYGRALAGARSRAPVAPVTGLSTRPCARPPRLTAGRGLHTQQEAAMNDHPYTHDRWATPDDPEHGVVRLADLRKIERTCQGIWAISRIVGNSANEPDSTGMQPLDPWIVSNLLGGIESLCDYVGNVVGAALEESPREFQIAIEQKPIH